MRLSDVKNRTATVTVEWFGETAQVTGYPGRITGEFIDRLTQAEQTGDEDEAERSGVYDGVCEVIAEWEVDDDDGSRLTVTPDAAKKLPISLLVEMVQSIQEAVRAEGKRSASGSRRTGR